MFSSPEKNTSDAMPAPCFVFNGDADGIISQHLYGLSGKAPSIRVTGLKRDIRLLARVSADEPRDLVVFDISFAVNRDDALRLLENPGTRIDWFDHHEPGVLPDSPRLRARINTARGTCTALIVHAALRADASANGGPDPRWAAMAAFGDNIPEAADALLAPLGLPASAREALREGGELLNYNAYGETEADVLFSPSEVAARMAAFSDPEDFLRAGGFIEPLSIQLREDEERMGGLVPADSLPGAALYTLPGEAWARRLGSTFANRAALADPGRAVAVLHPLEDGDWQVSLRAPRGRPDAPPASELAREFPSGGGRALAAGINRLSAGDAGVFARRFFAVYG